jgi:hypothetical protein
MLRSRFGSVPQPPEHILELAEMARTLPYASTHSTDVVTASSSSATDSTPNPTPVCTSMNPPTISIGVVKSRA